VHLERQTFEPPDGAVVAEDDLGRLQHFGQSVARFSIASVCTCTTSVSPN
jgi:hypothetical protein